MRYAHSSRATSWHDSLKMAYLALIFCSIVWGATFPATKVVLAQVPPFTFLLMRFVLGALVVCGLFLALGTRLNATRDVLRMSAIATVFLFIGYATQTVGLLYTTASNSAFITALYVILVPLFLRRFDRWTWISAGVALWGLWCLVNPTLTVNQGDLWTLVCAAGFAAHISCLEIYTRHGESPSLLAWQLLFVSLVLVPPTALESPASVNFSPTVALVTALIVCGVLATAALAAQIYAQRFVPAQRVALIFILEPVCAGLMAGYFLDEQLGPRGWLGSGLILIAIFLGTVRRQVAALPRPAETPAGG